MNDTQKLEFLLSLIQKEANLKHCYDKYGDDYSPCVNGNFDEAFEDGEEFGHIELARRLLKNYDKLNEPLTDT